MTIYDLIQEKGYIEDFYPKQLKSQGNGTLRGECAIHGNTGTPSFTLDTNNQQWHCHKQGCGKGGGIIQFVAHLNNITDIEATKILAERYEIPVTKEDKKLIIRRKQVKDAWKYFTELCHENFKDSIFYEQIKANRNFSDETIEECKIGWFNNILKAKINEKYKDNKKLLIDAGFINEKGNWAFGNRIVYPYFNIHDEPAYFIYRRNEKVLDFAKDRKYVKQKTTYFSQNIPYGLRSLKYRSDKPLIIAEGITDAISCLQLNYPTISAVTNQFSHKDYLPLVNYCKRYSKVIVIFDNEEGKLDKNGKPNNAGLKGAEKTLRFLMQKGINVYIGIIPKDDSIDKIDLNDYFKDNTAEDFERDVLNNAMEGFGYFLNKIHNDSTTSEIEEIFELMPKSDYIKIDEIKIKISKNKGVGKKVINEQFKQFNEKKAQLLEKKQETQEIIDDKIPEEYKTKVLEFLYSENKFDEIKEILDFNIYGEDNNKMLVFILLSGVYFGYYSIVVIIGQSSDGKSYLVVKIIELFPEKNRKTLTNASNKYLNYLGKDEKIKEHLKILFFNEAQRNREVLEQMKDFGDDGIKVGTLEKDQLGNYNARDLNLGKLSIVVTSTKEDLNIEFLNRAWRLEPDESKKQNEEIVNKDYSHRKTPWTRQTKKIENLEKKKILNYIFQYIQEDYNFNDITLPFANSIKDGLLNFETVQVRRDKNKLMDLIKKIACWNYKIRDSVEFNGVTYLIPHPNDLKIALDYGKEIFVNMTKNLTPEKIKILDTLNLMKKETIFRTLDANEKITPKTYYKTGEINKTLKKKGYAYTPKTLLKRLNNLRDNGYVDMVKDGKSNAYKSMVSNLKTEMDMEEILQNAQEEYDQFMQDIEDNDQLTLTKASEVIQ